MNRTLTSVAFCLVASWSLAASAQEAKVETVIGGLSNPCGVAVQPETGHVFVADSAAGRVIRIVDGKAQDVITGFPKDVFGKGPFYDVGPLGLVFLDKTTLVVGDGGFKDGEE
jgi:DNA-binding beta-propeller fold protein YncE